MSDPLESMLDRLGTAPSEPPAAFIHAVARRRHRRRLTQAATMACLGLAVAGAWLAFQARPTAPPLPPGPVAVSAPASSMLALRRVNAEMNAEELDLPELAGPGEDQSLSLGTRPERLERWLEQ